MILSETASIYRLVPSGGPKRSVYQNYKHATFRNIEFGAQLLGANVSISSFPKLHVQLWLTDGDMPSDATEVVYDKTTLPNTFAFTNCGDSGSANVSHPLYWRMVQNKLYLSVWSHNMNIVGKDFHGEVTVFYNG